MPECPAAPPTQRAGSAAPGREGAPRPKRGGALPRGGGRAAGDGGRVRSRAAPVTELSAMDRARSWAGPFTGPAAAGPPGCASARPRARPAAVVTRCAAGWRARRAVRRAAR
ncbi:hypothetical protein CRI70_19120 [Streptomyces sp. Ru87]|nr:hypothetical protein CRI70_19120 [Streptomyces sp. Ru87]